MIILLHVTLHHHPHHCEPRGAHACPSTPLQLSSSPLASPTTPLLVYGCVVPCQLHCESTQLGMNSEIHCVQVQSHYINFFCTRCRLHFLTTRFFPHKSPASFQFLLLARDVAIAAAVPRLLLSLLHPSLLPWKTPTRLLNS